ncbi:hypothetical protein PVAP13_3KG110900 [Panicum virgatum]|uniref:WAT1-related protein n=1 Tax=Panicum virgatum TaxID=38727 RepID=A0A8T0UHV8_PANVG|nr:hypothetical protein PVAP13_3KG110900 [Panicum virgatum]
MHGTVDADGGNGYHQCCDRHHDRANQAGTEPGHEQAGPHHFPANVGHCVPRPHCLLQGEMRPKFTTEIFMYTFLSGILGFESLEVRSKSGSAKISGTLISLGGAMMLTFYKGSALTHNTTSSMAPAASSSGGHRDAARWVLGSVSMLANVVGFALWLLLQRKFTKKYPAVYSATAFMSLFSFVQSGALTLSIQRSSIAVWALKGTIEIVTVVYCGVVASGVGYLLLTYCVEKRGPVFTAAFSPLSQIFVAGIDLSILHEPLYLGSVLGSVLVILGLYLVLWGKREEAANKDVASAKPVQAEVEQQAEKV